MTHHDFITHCEAIGAKLALLRYEAVALHPDRLTPDELDYLHWHSFEIGDALKVQIWGGWYDKE